MANYYLAEAQAKELITELAQISLPASRSLQEGLHELFTLQRLQVKELVWRIFSTTNAIESINSMQARQTRKMTRWTTKKEIQQRKFNLYK